MIEPSIVPFGLIEVVPRISSAANFWTKSPEKAALARGSAE
jgi:hypothetical protein